jgi:hypothetical protein
MALPAARRSSEAIRPRMRTLACLARCQPVILSLAHLPAGQLHHNRSGLMHVQLIPMRPLDMAPYHLLRSIPTTRVPAGRIPARSTTAR